MADTATELDALRARVAELEKAGDKMACFIRDWKDCLAGVQMSEDTFSDYCGLLEWRKASAALKGSSV